MGLHYAFHLVDQCTKTVSISDLPKRFTLVFDGLLFIYSTQNEACELEMADKVVLVIMEHIQLLHRHAPFSNFTTVFLLDGKSPHAKKHTQSKRNYPNKNIEMVKARLADILPIRGVQVLQLAAGEAECEALHQRPSGPIVIVTNDSDMFHLGYRYDMRNPNDKVFYAKRKFETIYDFSQPTINVDKTVFKILLFCCGTDFSASIITRSMFGDIMAHKNVLEELKLPPDPSKEKYLDLIILFCHLACIKTQVYKRNSSKCYFPRKRTNPSTNLNAYIDILQWCLSYSNQGVRTIKYKEQLPYVELDLVSTLGNIFQLEPCNEQTLKDKLISFSTHALVAKVNAQE